MIVLGLAVILFEVMARNLTSLGAIFWARDSTFGMP